MADGEFTGDPWTGQGSFTDESGNAIASDLKTWSGGRLYVSNGVLIDVYNPTNPLTLGKQGDFTATSLYNDRFSLVSQTQRGAINRTVYGESLRFVSGTVNVSLAGGDMTPFEIAPIPVSGINAQWVVHITTEGEYEYRTVRGPFATNADLQAEWGASFRLATAQEAAYSALFKSIITANSEALQSVIEAEGISGDSVHSAEYKAAALVMERLDWTSIHSHTSYIF